MDKKEIHRFLMWMKHTAEEDKIKGFTHNTYSNMEAFFITLQDFKHESE